MSLNTKADSLNLPPLLLTSAVVVGDRDSVKLKDPEPRIYHTLESIRNWLLLDPNLRIIVCDSTGFDYSNILAEHFPESSIESLSFQVEADLIKKYGKGYGEGEIVRYALDMSKTLKEKNYFAKCTTKLWVSNFHACLAEWNGSFLCHGKFENVFSWRQTNFNNVDTRFYISSVGFYKEHLQFLHRGIKESSPEGIEEMFRNYLIKAKLKNVLFRTPPRIMGVGGGSGTYYKASYRKHLKECLRNAILLRDSNLGQFFSRAR